MKHNGNFNYLLKLFLLMMSLLVDVTVSGQSLDLLWKKVERAVQEDNPQEVILQSGKLYEQAKKQKHVPEMLRAYLTRMAWRKNVSPDSLVADKKELLEMAETRQNKVDRSVIYFLYGLVTDTDAELYLKKAFALEEKDETLLQQLSSTSALNYKPLVLPGNASKVYNHDLLSLFRTTLESNAWKYRDYSWIKDVLVRDMALYKAQKNRQAALSVALEWDEQRFMFSLPTSRKQFLNALVEEYNDLPLCAEVENRLASEEPLLEAMARLKNAIARYPKYERIDELKSSLEGLVCPSASFHASATVYPGKSFSVSYSVFNVSSVQVSWRKVDDVHYLERKFYEQSYQEDAYLAKLMKESVPVANKQTCKISDKAFDRQDSSFSVVAPTVPGVYLVEIAPLACSEYPAAKAKKAYLPIVVSKWMITNIPVANKKNEIQILDSWTGKPVAFAQVHRYELKNNRDSYVKIATFKTDEQGVFLNEIPEKRTQQYWAVEKEGDKSSIIRLNESFFSDIKNVKQQSVQFFTDRSIYRPGQVVEYSLLVSESDRDFSKVVPQHEVIVSLWEMRRRKDLKKDSLKTDDYGVACGKFTLPSDCEPGTYQLWTNEGKSISFKVEEYKRPTYDVRWEPVTVSYKKGDVVALKGKALTFTDAPVQGAKVVLKTTCFEKWLWRNRNSHVISQDTLYTDDKGEIDYAVTLNLPEHFANLEKNSLLYDFAVEMIVTSKDGETHVAVTNLSIADNPYLLWIDAENQVNKKNIQPWTIHLTNLERVDQKQEVCARLFTAGEKKQVWEGTITSGSPYTPSFLATLASGRYVLEVTYDSLKLEKEFALVSMEDRTPLPGSNLWTFAESDKIDRNHEAVLQLGSSLSDAYIQYYIYDAKGRVERGSYVLSDSLALLHIPYKENYKDGVSVSLLLAQEGKVYTANKFFSVPKPDKRLKAEWISVRDFSQPGMKEEWKLKLTLPSGFPADANLMAVLYDASLDRIYSHHWNYIQRQFGNFHVPAISFGNTRVFRYMEFPALAHYKYLERLFDRFDNSLFTANIMRQEVKMLSARVSKNAAPMVMNDAAEGEVYQISTGRIEESAEPVNLRTEFQETAFFYPMLRTDESGVVSLDFTLPQSITEWHLMGFAHTKDMDYSSDIDRHLKIIQPFEVHPNMPRFIRKGDKVNLPVTIRNFSGSTQVGKLTFVLKDSTLTKDLVRKEMPFKVQESETFMIPFTAPDYEGGTICQVYASASDYSDGEQHELPVLSDEIWLEETRAYYLNHPEQVVSLENMMGNGKLWNKTSSLSVSVVNNPIWEVVKDLSNSKEQKSNMNAVDLALSFYAKCLSMAIVSQQPLLENNGMLVTDSLTCKSYLDQLSKLQQEDGGFAWFSGMGSSTYITRLLTESFVRLATLGIHVPERERFDGIVSRSMQYLDAEMLSYYKSVKKQKDYSGLNTDVLHYLYLHALRGQERSKEITEACRYFINALPKEISSLSIYQKAMAAIVLQANKKEEDALKFIRSVVSYSVYTEELGRYYDTPKAMYSWRNYRIPTQTMVVEGLAKVAPASLQVSTESEPMHKSLLLSDYIRWILNQKRTQAWDNSATTLDALYAILNVSPGQETLSMATDETVHQTYTYEDFSSFPKTWNLKKEATDSPVAWASIAVKSLVKQGNVVEEEPHTGLKLQVEYQREVVKNNKSQYETVALNTLKVGDKVRALIHLKTDRDMDFVEVNLPRAACLGPAASLSGYRWGNGLGYYYMVKDTGSRFCMDRLPKGSYEITEDFFVGLEGTYNTGIPTAQCTYAPEFSAHGTAVVMKVQ